MSQKDSNISFVYISNNCINSHMELHSVTNKVEKNTALWMCAEFAVCALVSTMQCKVDTTPLIHDL